MFYSEPFMERRRRGDKIFVTELHRVFHEFMSSALTTFMNVTLIAYQCSQKSELRHSFKGCNVRLYVKILACVSVNGYQPTYAYFFFSKFTSRDFQRLISLLYEYYLHRPSRQSGYQPFLVFGSSQVQDSAPRPTIINEVPRTLFPLFSKEMPGQ